jgi:hypothetical protein
MQPRGIFELRDLEQNATRSASAEDFAEVMKELHSQVKERLQNSSQEYKHRAYQHRRQLHLRLVIDSGTFEKGKVPERNI